MSNYDDIINLPHHRSNKFKHMDISDRAAQFSPFAALTGYEASIRETARLTSEKIEINEDRAALLNERMSLILKSISDRPFVKITYFVPDTKKSGGCYSVFSGNIRMVDQYNRNIIFTDDTKINIDDIISIDILKIN